MHVLIQWALPEHAVGGWETFEHTSWTQLPTLPDPTGTTPTLGERGWVHRVVCQGVVFSDFDRYWVGVCPDDPAAVRIAGVYDVARHQVVVWDFWPWGMKPTGHDHWQRCTRYFPPGAYQNTVRIVGTDLDIGHHRPWAERWEPPAHELKHGVRLSEAAVAALDEQGDAESMGYRCWTEGTT